jgi:hypothetical protein
MKHAFLLLAVGLSLLAGGCSDASRAPATATATAPASQEAATQASAPDATAPVAATDTRLADSSRPDGALPMVLVHKSPTCGCCTAWADHMRQAGFPVQVHETDALEPIRKQLGVPPGKGSCHTAEVAGLVVEGHVPAEDIKRLLSDPGDARGLVVPGMPMGSPGMEMPDGRVQPYTVERIHADGSTTPFATHGE